MAQILGQIWNNSSHPKNELRERSRWDIKSRWFLHVRRWFFFINHLRADTGKNFLIKATLGLKIPKKKFQFSQFSPNWFSAPQNLLGDSEPTLVGQKNPLTLNPSNMRILSKWAWNQFWQWFWGHFHLVNQACSLFT